MVLFLSVGWLPASSVNVLLSRWLDGSHKQRVFCGWKEGKHSLHGETKRPISYTVCTMEGMERLEGGILDSVILGGDDSGCVQTCYVESRKIDVLLCIVITSVSTHKPLLSIVDLH